MVDGMDMASPYRPWDPCLQSACLIGGPSVQQPISYKQRKPDCVFHLPEAAACLQGPMPDAADGVPGTPRQRRALGSLGEQTAVDGNGQIFSTSHGNHKFSLLPITIWAGTAKQ